jgi:hypothetical protein
MSHGARSVPHVQDAPADGMEARCARVFAAQHGLATLEQLRAAGATTKQLRHRRATGRWVARGAGVVALAGAPRTPRHELLAAVLGVGRGAVASHRSAAALLGLPGAASAWPPPEVTVEHAARPRGLDGVRLHRSIALPPHHLRSVDAIPTTSLARTLFDLGAVLHPGRLARLLDHALARRIVTLEACWRVVHELARPGRPGSAALRALLDERGHGQVAPASELEARVLTLLVASGLPAPRREVDLGGDSWIGRVEFVWLVERLLLEVDSRLHHSALSDWEADRERENRFVAKGFRVLRVTWPMVRDDPDGVVCLVRDALACAA